jgi:hypothetical protein
MGLKSFLFTLAIFCGGYVSNTLLDSAVDAAQTYFHFHTSTYKTDANGYIICSTEKPKITDDNVRPLTLNASRPKNKAISVAISILCIELPPSGHPLKAGGVRETKHPTAFQSSGQSIRTKDFYNRLSFLNAAT